MSSRVAAALFGARSSGVEGRSLSVELPMWRALAGLRVLALGWAVFRYADTFASYAHPLGGWLYLGLLTAWTLATLRFVTSAERCVWPFLVLDLTIALTGIMLTVVVDTSQRVAAGVPTLPTMWSATPVIAFSIKGGWKWGALASTLVGVGNVVERGAVTERNLNNIVLLFVASAAIGYVVELARASERTLARALQVEAATQERERLARDIHDNVLQVLAMVQRRGAEIGGEAAELGRLAGAQEVALRALFATAAGAGAADGTALGVAAVAGGAPPGGAGRDSTADVRDLLRPRIATWVTLAAPGTPVLLDVQVAGELVAAVSAALDNVRKHAGSDAKAWILLEDWPDEVLVSVRDNGPGIPAGRLAAAEREGRLGVVQSICGRMRDLGGSAEINSIPGQGTEVELRVPRQLGPATKGAPGETGNGTL